ncbi:hypothetical protein WMY93_010803 [Mugilogobius chulae]|uniref:Solute carrier family 16 member 3 n=1 Tax=Mugilogobius chulae TaxID=88201 RepID=A0AAW0PHE4_9GOBI
MNAETSDCCCREMREEKRETGKREGGGVAYFLKQLFTCQRCWDWQDIRPQEWNGWCSGRCGPPGVKAPDGGWGWAVLIGCFVITGFSYAFPKAVSVFFKELIHEFGVGYSDMAWISSILLAMLYGTGPLCSMLVNRYGCRPVMIVGGFLASLGMILASFATSVIHIYVCTGMITGLGLALNFQPSLIMLNLYFNENVLWPMGWQRLAAQWPCAVSLLWGSSSSTSMAGEEVSSSLEGFCLTVVPVEP